MPDLYNAAYNRYQQEGQDLYNQYGLLSDRENQAYSRYRDAVNDYYSDLSDARNAYSSAYANDYNQWSDQLSYWASKANSENAAYLQQLAAQSKASGGSGGGSGGGASGLTDRTLINGYGDFESNKAMLDASYRGVKKTIETQIAQGNLSAAYQTAINAQSQMSYQQWADISRRIFELTGKKIDDAVNYYNKGTGTAGAAAKRK